MFVLVVNCFAFSIRHKHSKQTCCGANCTWSIWAWHAQGKMWEALRSLVRGAQCISYKNSVRRTCGYRLSPVLERTCFSYTPEMHDVSEMHRSFHEKNSALLSLIRHWPFFVLYCHFCVLPCLGICVIGQWCSPPNHAWRSAKTKAHRPNWQQNPLMAPPVRAAYVTDAETAKLQLAPGRVIRATTSLAFGALALR